MQYRVADSFEGILDLVPAPDVIAVDIPIGLLDERVKGGRECDRLARQMSGRPRASSVFSPPIRKALKSRSYPEAEGFGLSRQSYGILRKIAEVDLLMARKWQERVREVHPEVCFWAMTGGAMKHNKKSQLGRKERVRALASLYSEIKTQVQAEKPPGVGMDDLLDAYAAAWTAARIVNGKAERVPDDPPRDTKGLRMEIWY